MNETTQVVDALGIVFDEDDRQNVARFTVDSEKGNYTIEFTDGDEDGPYWNIASFPPDGPPDGFEVVQTDEDAFWLVESDASSVDEAHIELTRLVASISGVGVGIVDIKTFHSPVIKSTRDWLEEFRDLVLGWFQ